MSAIVATWPVGTFVENLVALPDGRLVVSVHSRQELQQIDRHHARTMLATLEASPTGLAVVGESLFVNAGEPGQPGWRILLFDLDGTARSGFAVPNARFLNGLTPFRHDRLLAVDSILGQVLEVDAHHESTSVWLSHELLTKTTSDPLMPGVNGIKVFGGHVYLTSTERALVLRVPIDAVGCAGPVEILAERFVADDLALDVEGNLYLTTHVGNTLERLSPGGERRLLAGPDDGLHGSTAVAFGRTAADLRTVYVTTTGGVVAPVDGRMREAKLVAVEVAGEGAALTDSLFHHLGGHRALRRAAECFYESILKDPLLQPLFGEGNPHHVDRLTAFFTEVFGGPAEYTKQRGGFDTIMRAHRGLGIREEQRHQFVQLLVAAADTAQLPADARFRRAWAEHADFGSRVAMQNANARSDAELHPLRTVPHWDW